MRVAVHPRVMDRHPEVSAADAETAFIGSLRSRPRDTAPVQWAGIGMDGKGRLLEYVAVEAGPDEWLVFHAMPATNKVMIEVGLKGRKQRWSSTPP